MSPKSYKKRKKKKRGMDWNTLVIATRIKF